VAFTTSNGQVRSSLADINITPLVDVVLVLLVIFMITAPVLQSGIEVNVPKTRTVKEITEQRMVVTIDRDQTVPFGAFASVMDAVKQAGITNVSIVTQPLDTKSGAAGGN
jgi:biopolymer transport protein ExbD/biopolymer transport protein TolR